jgi:hypothetical protein
MNAVNSSWADHLHSLPASSQAHGQALRLLVAQSVQVAGAPLLDFVFLPEQSDHVKHEDAAQVFDAAFHQMLLRKPVAEHEVPLLFVGYHVATRFTGSRFAQGFLLSDQAVYVQDDFSVISEAPLPVAHALPQTAADVPAFAVRLVQRYARLKDWAVLGDASPQLMAEQVGSLLLAAVQAVLAYHAQHGSQQQLVKKPITPAEFVASHGLDNTLLLGSNSAAAKKLGKVAAKFQIPADETIKLALVDFPFLGGPYGLALTAQALYTRDLMESPQRLALADVDSRTLRYSDDGKEMRLNGTTPLFFPNHIKTSVRDELLELLKQQIGLPKS